MYPLHSVGTVFVWWSFGLSICWSWYLFDRLLYDERLRLSGFAVYISNMFHNVCPPTWIVPYFPLRVVRFGNLSGDAQRHLCSQLGLRKCLGMYVEEVVRKLIDSVPGTDVGEQLEVCCSWVHCDGWYRMASLSHPFRTVIISVSQCSMPTS